MSTLPKMSITRRLKAVFWATNLRSGTQGTATRRIRKKRMDIPQASIGMIRNIKSLGKYLRIVKHCPKERFDVRTWDARSEEEWRKIGGDRSQTAIFLPSLNMCIVFEEDKCHPLVLCRMVLHIRAAPTHRHLKKEMRIIHCGQKKTREKKP